MQRGFSAGRLRAAFDEIEPQLYGSRRSIRRTSADGSRTSSASSRAAADPLLAPLVEFLLPEWDALLELDQ
jgi:hypothetical protein